MCAVIIQRNLSCQLRFLVADSDDEYGMISVVIPHLVSTFSRYCLSKDANATTTADDESTSQSGPVGCGDGRFF